VSISDPDRAANTLTFVPGVGSGLAGIDSSLDAIDNIEDASADLQPSDTWSPVAAGDLATIGWVNYDAPPTVGSAIGIARANSAAPNLSNFESGLRVTSADLGAHESVLGYSYGSVVVGAAAAQYGLDDDEIIMVASPGTTVKNAAALRIDPSHVWATAAPRDPIKLATNPINWIKHLFGAPAKSWFGMSPIDPAYGARVFTSDAVPAKSAHTSYFDPGTSTVINVAKIALGDGSDVH
jgi:Alpha/beta hydrolase